MSSSGLSSSLSPSFWSTRPESLLAGSPIPFHAYLAWTRYTYSVLHHQQPSATHTTQALRLPDSFHINNSQVSNFKTVVIFGNEASDVDSMFCALVTAWYLAHIFPPNKSNHIFLPLINIPRKEIPLRPEAAYCMDSVGVQQCDLICLDDIDFNRLKSNPGGLGIILVDHNALASRQTNLGEHVVGIIDHHYDEKAYMNTTEGNRILEVVGSCTSLLTRVIRTNFPCLIDITEAKFSKATFSWQEHVDSANAVARLLMDVMLLDTHNFSPVQNKAKPADHEAFKWLTEAVVKIRHHELKKRRSDVSNFTTEQLVMKDAKFGQTRVHHVISSIPGSLSNMFARDPQAIKSIVALTREQNLRFTILLSSFTDKVTNVYQRQVLVVVLKENPQDEKNTSRDLASQALFDSLTTGMENEKQALNLEIIDLPKEADVHAHTEIAIVRCYNQHNLGSSRKQVAPLMTKILSKL